jgi:aldehyde dehydrogenase (NAD+)
MAAEVDGSTVQCGGVVRNPFSGEVVGAASQASPADVERAVAAADGQRPELAGLSTYARASTRDRVSRRLIERAEEVAQPITAEAIPVTRRPTSVRW